MLRRSEYIFEPWRVCARSEKVFSGSKWPSAALLAACTFLPAVPSSWDVVVFFVCGLVVGRLVGGWFVGLFWLVVGWLAGLVVPWLVGWVVFALFEPIYARHVLSDQFPICLSVWWVEPCEKRGSVHYWFCCQHWWTPTNQILA